ncbi:MULTISPECIES: carbohydrate kinase family protein [unclassified Rhizobium]|uniref:carbohydrate kinase family protein n=1 Tax=unclassified Rhizobium TaxID=2613769 RepID=UPI0007010D77|nr:MULTISPECIES: carbohydrate kinase family protein [unclassified Rhizobium]KQV42752.1 ribokinase [Rhizobium sp. Root1212]KRD36486.1 ribokinase [Rhizobium sp. Root268]
MAAIVLLGDINIDLVLAIPSYPGEGGEAIATGQTAMIGGSATNTAFALAKAGHDCRLIGRVGIDSWGREALTELAAAGISTRWIGRDELEPTQINVITVSPAGERTMFAYRGANARLSAADVDPAAFAGAALFHLSGYALLQPRQAEAALTAIDIAVDADIPVTLDIPGGVVAGIATHVRTLLPRIDTILLGSSDLPGLLGQPKETEEEKLIAMLLENGVRRVAVKGSGGTASCLHTADGRGSAPWFPVEVIDTIGAGDAFAAGHIHGRVTGLSGPDCCRLANAYGALAVTRKGAGRTMPARDEVCAFLEKIEHSA